MSYREPYPREERPGYPAAPFWRWLFAGFTLRRIKQKRKRVRDHILGVLYGKRWRAYCAWVGVAVKEGHDLPHSERYMKAWNAWGDAADVAEQVEAELQI